MTTQKQDNKAAEHSLTSMWNMYRSYGDVIAYGSGLSLANHNHKHTPAPENIPTRNRA